MLEAPIILEGLPGDGSINLLWSPVASVTVGYNVRIGITSGCYTYNAVQVGASITEVLLTNGSITGGTTLTLTNGTSYYITVAAADVGAYPYVDIGDTAFEIVRAPSDTINFETFRTIPLTGYLPNTNIIGSLPFRIPETTQGFNELLDFDFEAETFEDDIEYSEVITKGSGDYDSLSNTGIISISNLRDSYGNEYDYLTDFYLFRDRVYWSGSTPTVGVTYNINYTYCATLATYYSNPTTGISGSSLVKIKDINFITAENITHYLNVYDIFANNTVYVNIYNSLISCTTSTGLYAYADIDPQSGYYASTTDNLLKDTDPSFENSVSTWTVTGSISSTISTDYAKFGTHSLKMYGTVDSTTNNYIYVQNILIEPTTQYVLSGYNKVLTFSATYNSYIEIEQYNILNQLITVPPSNIYSTTITVATDWTRVIVPFTSDTAASTLKIKLITNTTSGTATIANYWDGMQLETNTYVSPFVATSKDNNTIDADIIKVSDSSVIGSISVKFTPSLPATIFKYDPITYINFQNGNVVKAFEVDFNDRVVKKDRTIKFKTRVIGPSFETNWSDYNSLFIPRDYSLEVNEGLFNNLPDENVYPKDLLKVDPSLRNHNVYNILGAYSSEFDGVYYQNDRTADDYFTDACQDVNFEKNRASYFDIIKPTTMQWSDFRHVVKQMGVAALNGSTSSAIKRMANAFTGVDPNILLVRDYDWWLLNGNMLHNPSFELNANYFGAVPYWTLPTLTAACSKDATETRFGTYSLLLTISAGSPANAEVVSDYMPVDVSKEYSLSYYYNTPLTYSINNLYANIYYYSSDGTLLGTELKTSANPILTDFWDRFTCTATMPTTIITNPYNILHDYTVPNISDDRSIHCDANYVYKAGAGNGGGGYTTLQKFDYLGNLIWDTGAFSFGLGSAWDVTTDSLGNVYVCDVDTYRIRKFSSAGVDILNWGTNGSGNGQFLTCKGITRDSDDNIYVVDYTRNDVQKFDSSGTFILKFGGTGYTDGLFSSAWSIESDKYDNIYVLEYSNASGCRIQKFDKLGNFIKKYVIPVTTINGYVATNNTYDIVFVTDANTDSIYEFDSNLNLIQTLTSPIDGYAMSGIAFISSINDSIFIRRVLGVEKFSFAQPSTLVTSKVKVALGVNGQAGRVIRFDGAQFEEGSITPYEDFEYYLDDPLYPEIVPPTLWDKNEYAYSIILQVRNPYGFTLDQDLVKSTILKFVPAHTKIYVQFLTAGQSSTYLVWDEGAWDENIWS